MLGVRLKFVTNPNTFEGRELDGCKNANTAVAEHSFPYVGIVNKGRASYSNSVLQMLYHIPYFRQTMRQMPSQMIENDNPLGSVTSALQNLFDKLQCGGTAVEAEEFITAFGWDRTKHHDAHDFYMTLFQKLEDEGADPNDTIQQLFFGHYQNFIKCFFIDFSRSIKEPFHGLQLVVELCDHVYDSLDKYLETQALRNDNQYNMGGRGLQDASLKCSFIELPPVLLLQLKRFDFSGGSVVKINDRFEYPLRLDLDRAGYFSSDAYQERVDLLYKLHSVVVHEGDALEGHYHVYIRPTRADRWFKFDDESVEEVNQELALRQFGSDKRGKYGNLGCAYLLTYIRESDEAKYFCDAGETDTNLSRIGSVILMPANTEKRHKLKEDNSSPSFDHVELLGGLPKEQLGLDEQTVLQENTSLRAKVVALEEELKTSRQEFQLLKKELKDLKDYEQQINSKRTKVIRELLISVSKNERQEARMKVSQESMRLCNAGVIRGTNIPEAWEDGQAVKDLDARLENLLKEKQATERQYILLKEQKPDKSDGDVDGGLQEEDPFIRDEKYRSHLASIQHEEDMIMQKRDQYELEKGRLIREMKLIRDEDGSRFNTFEILNHRYALLNLLGKGGFSEVYKAFDLVEHRYVACKLHGLDAQWSENKKQTYIWQATMERNIHKTLMHHHIVRLWDTFDIDQNTFCTVLEYCSGKDLDAVLKETQMLSEQQAKFIIVQIFQALVYLNKGPQKIIHYDLKPGNVLFDEFRVAKVTDFGLSKIVKNDVGSQGMELTSQGAGTYWYLPPECFEPSGRALISSKVDVWSAGILLYQMLFGKRPFGHDQSQMTILREHTILKAERVEFPTRPAVSNEAKEFIRRCLTYNQAERPDVLTIAQDPYLIDEDKDTDRMM